MCNSGHQVVEQDFSDSFSLKLGDDRTVIDRRLVDAVGNRPAEAYELVGVKDEYGGVARFESFSVHFGFVERHADALQDVRNFLPVHSRTIFFYVELH